MYARVFSPRVANGGCEQQQVNWPASTTEVLGRVVFTLAMTYGHTTFFFAVLIALYFADLVRRKKKPG